MLVSLVAIVRLGFNWREKLFIMLAWLPKATVQAAIGSQALDTARAKHAPDADIELGIQVAEILGIKGVQYSLVMRSIVLYNLPYFLCAYSLASPSHHSLLTSINYYY